MNTDVRIMTSNIWGDYFKNPVQIREEQLQAVYERYHPDVLALQEATGSWWNSRLFAWLYKEYTLVDVEREIDAWYDGEEPEEDKNTEVSKHPGKNYVPLFYKTGKYQCLEKGWEHFEKTPDPSKCITWAVLKDVTTNKVFGVCGTHLWWKTGEEHDRIRQRNMAQLFRRMQGIHDKYGVDVFSFGDMNCNVQSVAYQYLIMKGCWNLHQVAEEACPLSSHHGDPTLGEDGRYHGNCPELDYESSIDHIVALGQPRIKAYQVVTDQEALDATDHSPVYIDAVLEDRKYFVGSTEKNALDYECNEKMVFKVRLLEDGNPFPCPLLKWIWEADDGNLDSGCVSGGEGKEIAIEAKISKPGYVHLIVEACDEKGNPIPRIDKFEGGAGAEISKLDLGKPVPEDFHVFWEQVKQQLDTVRPEIIEKKKIVLREYPDFACFDLKIAMPFGRPVSAYLILPKDAKPKSLPVRLQFQGYSVVGSIWNVLQGYALLVVNAHGIENGREDAYYKELREGELCDYGFHREENKRPETSYFRSVLARDLQAVRFARTLPEWDGKTLEAAGGSQGAFQALSMAALDSGITFCDLVIPWICDLGGVTIGRLPGWRPDYEPGLSYYDTAVMATQVRCPVKISAGLGDYVCPPSGVTVLYNKLNVKKCLTFIQNRTHPYVPPVNISYTRAENWEI